MTENTAKILQYIESTIIKYGHAPTVREIMCAVGLKSTSSVFEQLKTLEKNNLIEKTENGTIVARRALYLPFVDISYMSSSKMLKVDEYAAFLRKRINENYMAHHTILTPKEAESLIVNGETLSPEEIKKELLNLKIVFTPKRSAYGNITDRVIDDVYFENEGYTVYINMGYIPFVGSSFDFGV